MLIKKLLVLAIPVLLMIGCKDKCIEDSGVQANRGTVVKNFDKIKVSGAIKLVLRQDSSYAVKIITDSNIIDYVKVDVGSNELRLKMDENLKYCGGDSVVAEVGIGVLKALNGKGAVKVLSDGLIYADDVELTFSGSSDVSLNLNAGKLTTFMDGIGKLHLTGQAGIHNLATQGTAEVNAFDFVAGVYNIDINGSGKAQINVLNELKVKTEGASDVYYKGNPKNVKEDKSGAAKLEKVN